VIDETSKKERKKESGNDKEKVVYIVHSTLKNDLLKEREREVDVCMKERKKKKNIVCISIYE
jgi:hypothetical protein